MPSKSFASELHLYPQVFLKAFGLYHSTSPFWIYLHVTLPDCFVLRLYLGFVRSPQFQQTQMLLKLFSMVGSTSREIIEFLISPHIPPSCLSKYTGLHLLALLSKFISLCLCHGRSVLLKKISDVKQCILLLFTCWRSALTNEVQRSYFFL